MKRYTLAKIKFCVLNLVGLACLAVSSSIYSETAASVEKAYSSSSNLTGFAAVIRSEKSAILSTQIDGLITDVLFAEGESFREGDKLISLNCSMPYAEQEKAKAQLQLITQEHKSNIKLSKLDSISDMTLAKSAAEVKKATVESATAKHKVDRCSIHAPFAGSIIRWHVRKFENVQAENELVEIVNNDDLKIEFLLPSELLSKIEDKQHFDLHVLESDQLYQAKVKRIIPKVDSVSQTVKVVGEFIVSTDELWSGMSGSVRFPFLTNQ